MTEDSARRLVYAVLAQEYRAHRSLWIGTLCLALGAAMISGLVVDGASSLRNAASIDIKKDEPGLMSFCAENGLPFETFTAAQLQNAPGEFTASEFVRSTVGVDSVCERAAVVASGNGSILLRKYAKNGVTAALAVQERRFCFED